MAQYYVNFNVAGNIIGFYLESIHGDSIPKEAVPISEEEWRTYAANGGQSYKRAGGSIRQKTQAELDEEIASRPPVPPSVEERLKAAEDALTALLGL